jgi:hypothetical protein
MVTTSRINGALSTLAIKAPCRAVAIANITLSGQQTVNGVFVESEDRVLVTAQTDATKNGIWIASTGAWERAPDFDGNRDVVDGTLVTVNKTTGMNFFYQVSTASDPVVIGTSTISFLLASDPSVTYPITQAEIDAGLTTGDIVTDYPFGNIRRYGTVGDGVADDTTAIQNCIDSIEEQGGGVMFIPIGKYKITAALVVDTLTNNTESIVIRGEGSWSDGSVILNQTNDVETFYLDGNIANASIRLDRWIMENFRIEHEAATKYAIRIEEAPYGHMRDMVIYCNLAGYGGIKFGTSTVTPDSDNYLVVMDNVDVREYTDRGVTVNSKGHSFQFRSCKVGSSAADVGARDADFQTEGVHVIGGQWGGSDNGIMFDNRGTGDIEYGCIENIKMEGVNTGQYGIRITGTNASPKDFAQIKLKNIGWNMSGQDGTLALFDYARQCKLIDPVVRNPTSGSGKLVEWTANSVQCELICDYEAAQAALTVNASAIRATKVVTGVMARGQVQNITVYANLRTILRDGVDDLPAGFKAVHNGVAWNYWHKTFADDQAFSFTPPNQMGIIHVLNDDEISTWGIAAYDCRAGGAFTINLSDLTSTTAAPTGLTDFEVTTGILTATTGNNLKTTFSAHTDGLVYVNARKGGGDYTMLFYPVTWGV